LPLLGAAVVEGFRHDIAANFLSAAVLSAIVAIWV
jgi:hypothetical protein